MKSLRIGLLAVSFCLTALVSFGQDLKTETIPVSGNCGMCKSNIEKAAKKAGVADANWDEEKKMLTVKYNETATTTAKIQQSVAEAGYDTRDVRATDASYKKLHACCQYDRAGSKDDKKPASSQSTEKEDVSKASCCAPADKDGKTAACCAPAEKDGKVAACCTEKH